MTYETGVFVGLLFWLWSSVMIVVKVNSQLERNLNKVGLRHSWVTFSSKPFESSDRDRPGWRSALKYLLIISFNFVFIFFSWLYVLLIVGRMIYAFSNAYGKPQVIKEAQWKLRNTEMSFDQILKVFMKADDIAPETFESYRENTLRELAERGL